VFILEHYFASKLVAVVPEIFISVGPDEEVPNKSIPIGKKISGRSKFSCVFEKSVVIFCKPVL
jgi:hypothetical protein